MGNVDLKLGGFGGTFSLNKRSVAGILTVDTVSDFLPRKGPFRQRRTGIAYMLNVAVRETDRKKGIAEMVVAKADARARSWGCCSIALHCDAINMHGCHEIVQRSGLQIHQHSGELEMS